jgi:transposase
MHPRQLRDVAQASGAWAQPAALEAGVIAPVADAVRPTPRPRPDETPPPLAALLPRRRPRLERWVAAPHRVALAHPTGRDRRARHLDELQGLIHATAEAGAMLIRPSPAWWEHDDVGPSAPGLGPVLSATLPAAGPE